MRLKSDILGCLNMFITEPGGLTDADVYLARALADVASIAIVQDLATREAAIREGHLQHALNSRIAIEQAKGMIAEKYSSDMDDAFARARVRHNDPGPRVWLFQPSVHVNSEDATRFRPAPLAS